MSSDSINVCSTDGTNQRTPVETPERWIRMMVRARADFHVGVWLCTFLAWFLPWALFHLHVAGFCRCSLCASESQFAICDPPNFWGILVWSLDVDLGKPLTLARKLTKVLSLVRSIHLDYLVKLHMLQPTWNMEIFGLFWNASLHERYPWLQSRVALCTKLLSLCCHRAPRFLRLRQEPILVSGRSCNVVQVPTRTLPLHGHDEVYESSRALVTATLMDDIWITGGVVYGEPDGHLYPQHNQHNELLLQAVVSQVCGLAVGPRFVAGDWNSSPNSLPVFALLQSFGFRDIQDVAWERWGIQPKKPASVKRGRIIAFCPLNSRFWWKDVISWTMCGRTTQSCKVSLPDSPM